MKYIFMVLFAGAHNDVEDDDDQQTSEFLTIRKRTTIEDTIVGKVSLKHLDQLTQQRLRLSHQIVHFGKRFAQDL